MELASRQQVVSATEAERRRLEQRGVVAAQRIGATARMRALQALRAGNDPAAAVRVVVAEMVPLVRDAMVAGHLQGRFRTLATTAPRIRAKAGYKLAGSAYDEAIGFLEKRLKLDPADLEALAKTYDAEALRVVNTASASLEKRLQQTIIKTTQEGEGVKGGIVALRKVFEAEGFVPGSKHTLEAVFRTQTMTAYSAGRWQTAQDPAVDEILWGFEFVALEDERTTPQCLAADDTRLPKDDAWWNIHWPPLHYNCRSTTVEIFKGDRNANATKRPEGADPDAGFNYNPGKVFPGPDLTDTKVTTPTSKRPTLRPTERVVVERAAPVVEEPVVVRAATPETREGETIPATPPFPSAAVMPPDVNNTNSTAPPPVVRRTPVEASRFVAQAPPASSSRPEVVNLIGPTTNKALQINDKEYKMVLDAPYEDVPISGLVGSQEGVYRETVELVARTFDQSRLKNDVEPIVVVKLPGGVSMIGAGHHRVSGAIAVGVESIPAKVIDWRSGVPKGTKWTEREYPKDWTGPIVNIDEATKPVDAPVVVPKTVKGPSVVESLPKLIPPKPMPTSGGVIGETPVQSNTRPRLELREWAVKIEPHIEREMLDAMQELNDRFTGTEPVERLIVDPVMTEDRGALATKSGTAIYVGNRFTADESFSAFQREWKGLSISAQSRRATIAHEYGHILDGRLLNAKGTGVYKAEMQLIYEESVDFGGQTIQRWQGDLLDGKTFYGQEAPNEWVAEAFADHVTNGTNAAPSSKRVGAVFEKHFGRPVQPVAAMIDTVVPAPVRPAVPATGGEAIPPAPRERANPAKMTPEAYALKELVRDKVDYGTLEEPLQRAINDGLTRALDEFPTLGKIRHIKIETRPTDKGETMFGSNGDDLEFNPTTVRALSQKTAAENRAEVAESREMLTGVTKENITRMEVTVSETKAGTKARKTAKAELDRLQKVLGEQQRSKRFSVVEEFDGVDRVKAGVIHEMGHVVDLKGEVDFQKEIRGVLAEKGLDKLDEDWQQISDYAASHPAEAFAEITSAMLMGRQDLVPLMTRLAWERAVAKLRKLPVA